MSVTGSTPKYGVFEIFIEQLNSQLMWDRSTLLSVKKPPQKAQQQLAFV
jgi:hypothetical protein